MFSAFELTQCRCTIKINDYRTELGDNVFEPLARRKYPEIDQAMKWLEQYATAKLSGTGAGILLISRTKYLHRPCLIKNLVDISWICRQKPAGNPFIDMDSGHNTYVQVNTGAWPSGKAPGFDPGIRRFESCRPSHFAVMGLNGMIDQSTQMMLFTGNANRAFSRKSMSCFEYQIR